MPTMTNYRIVNDIYLTVINDGNGSQCGMTYSERCAHARAGEWIALWRAAREYGRTVGATRAEVSEAATRLIEYYRDHVAEMAVAS